MISTLGHDRVDVHTCAVFLERAAAYFAAQGITSIERAMTDNAFAYRQPGDIKRSAQP